MANLSARPASVGKKPFSAIPSPLPKIQPLSFTTYHPLAVSYPSRLPKIPLAVSGNTSLSPFYLSRIELHHFLPLHRWNVLACNERSTSRAIWIIKNAPTLNYKTRIFIRNCLSPNVDGVAEIAVFEEPKEEAVVEDDISGIKGEDFSENESLIAQMVEIVKFSGPDVGLWICGPLMSLIDTVGIVQGSSIELATLGTVFCDNASYVFMFLSIATSNLVAIALARGDKKEVQHQISILLFIGLACGFLMLFFTRFYGPWALPAFTGAKNT